MTEVLGDHIFNTRLNRHLIAQFRAVDYDGNLLADEPGVAAAVLEGGTHSLQENWQSVFESMGPESKAPALAAMLQSGAVAPLAQALRDTASNLAKSQNDSLLGGLVAEAASAVSSGASKTNDDLLAVRGRAGITKLNSMQIFSGAAPSKLSPTLLFKAYKDPVNEVMRPLQQIMEWAVPRELSRDGVVVGALTGSNKQSGLLNNLLPSLAPNIISVIYGGRRYMQMVIESLEEPITSPRDRNGNYIEVVLPITLATLTAQDQADVKAMFERRRQSLS